jgi:hypothetical protein
VTILTALWFPSTMDGVNAAVKTQIAWSYVAKSYIGTPMAIPYRPITPSVHFRHTDKDRMASRDESLKPVKCPARLPLRAMAGLRSIGRRVLETLWRGASVETQVGASEADTPEVIPAN